MKYLRYHNREPIMYYIRTSVRFNKNVTSLKYLSEMLVENGKVLLLLCLQQQWRLQYFLMSQFKIIDIVLVIITFNHLHMNKISVISSCLIKKNNSRKISRNTVIILSTIIKYFIYPSEFIIGKVYWKSYRLNICYIYIQ